MGSMAAFRWPSTGDGHGHRTPLARTHQAREPGRRPGLRGQDGRDHDRRRRGGLRALSLRRDSPEDVLQWNGQLYVFMADDADGTADIAKGDELSGRFEPVDEADNADAATLQAAADDAGAFKFVRLEDVTYDRTDTTTIYFTDTGDNAGRRTWRRRPASRHGQRSALHA